MFLNTKYSDSIVNPSLQSYRILYDFEKERVEKNFKLYNISVKNWNCVSLGAKVGDIVSIKNHITTVYRRVIE